MGVFEVTGNYDAKNPDSSNNAQPRQAIVQEYIRTHGDTFDFTVFLSTFDYAMVEAEANGFYTGVRNDTQGINQPIMDNTALYGSTGKLQGTIDLGNVSVLAANPYGPKLDETLLVLNHEIMHRFGAYVRFKNTDGSLNAALLGKNSAHWSYLLDSKGSLMYGNGWKDNNEGTFTSTAAINSYSPLDLYLMGMIDKSQVSPMLLIDNPAIDKTLMPQLGATITGTAKTVTIDDIIAAEGPRIPDSSQSQKKFNVGFVLLTRPGDDSTAAASAIETLRSAWAGRFAEMTQGTGGINGVAPSVSVVIDSPSDGATITGPDVTVTGMYINSTGAETGVTVNGVPATVSGSRFVINHVPLQLGANSITITATDVNSLTITASRNVTAMAGNYIRITSNIESGVAPLNISFRLDGSFSIVNSTLALSGPTSVTLTPGTSPAEYSAQLDVEGTYSFTASAVGPDGQTYTDMVTITAISKEKLDFLLKKKWEGMLTALARHDIEGALVFFRDSSRASFRKQFTFLSAVLPDIAAELAQISMVRVLGNTAEYDLRTVKNGTTYSFLVQIVIDEDGIWRIRTF